MRTDRIDDDPLKEFIDPVNIERAPEGFSPKLMSLIYLETKIVRKEKNYTVPIISGIVTIIFIAAALLLPGSSLPFQLISLPENLGFKMPELNTGFEIPEIILPVLAGIVLLVLFDLLLNGLFNKRKYQG